MIETMMIHKIDNDLKKKAIIKSSLLNLTLNDFIVRLIEVNTQDISLEGYNKKIKKLKKEELKNENVASSNK